MQAHIQLHQNQNVPAGSFQHKLCRFSDFSLGCFDHDHQHSFDGVLVFTGRHFCRNSYRTRLQLCKLCDSDSANPTDPSNHIVANHQQVALGIAKRGKKPKILTLKCAIMIDVVSSTTAFCGTTFSLSKTEFAKFDANHCLLQIGTTARSWSQWMRLFRRRSRWRVLGRARDTTRPRAQEATRTRGEVGVQGEGTVPKRESDWSFSP